MNQAARNSSQNWILGLLVMFSTLSLRAEQPPEILYARSPQPTASLTANASVCDAAGNLYVTGDGGSIYLTKYDPSGNVLWTRASGGSGAALTLDGAGGVFLTGTYPGNNGNVFTVGGNFITAYGKTMFIARYDGNGNLLWVQRGGGWLKSFQLQSAQVTVNSLAHDTAGNVIVAGSYFGSPTIGGALNSQETNGAILLVNKNPTLPTAYEDLFLAKFDPNGALLWATNYGGTNTEYATSVAVDSTGAIYASGSFTFNTVMGALTYTNANDGILLAKFSSAGDLLWSSNLSDATNANTGAGWAVAVDAADRVTFSFQGDHPISLFRFHGYSFTNTPGYAASYLSQFDSNGNVLWLQRSPLSTGGIPNGAKYQRGRAINLAVDKQNNIYQGGGGLFSGVGALAILKSDSNGLPIWTNVVPAPITGIGFGLPMPSVDDAYVTHVTTTMTGYQGSALTVGWTNYYPFATFSQNQLLFVIASNFVAVPPFFVQQPTNMVYQPPKGLTNSAQAHAWPAPTYSWFINSSKLPGQTNFTLALSPTTFTNQTSYFVVASNSYGLATSVVVNAQAALSFAPSPPASLYVLVGTTLAISGGASGTSAATYQWQYKGTNIANATSTTLALPNITLNQGGNYTLVLSNASTVITSTPPSVVTVLPVGSIDPGYINNSTAPVSSLARVSDGSYLAANGYSAYHVSTNGLIATNGFVVYPYRWNDSSSADQYLGPSLVVRQPDDKIMVAGNFKVYYTNATTFTNASRIARLNPNGTLDASFNVGVGPLNTIDGTNYTKIECVIPLANGQYLVAGTFSKFNGLPITNLVRLNNDGSLDNTFPRHSFRNAGSGSGTIAVHSIALQADGKLLLGGVFDVMDGVTNRDLTRLTTNGTVDATFVQTSLAGTQGFGDQVNTLLVLPDGKILAAGAGQYALVNRAARFNADGSRDLTWVGILPSEVYCVTLTASNKLIFGCKNCK